KDVFFKEEYKVAIRENLYETYPVLKDKKIVLFAPTFRGNGVGTAYYPFERFDTGKLLKTLGEDYVLIIKHHPFVKETHPVDDKIGERILDLSKESEINDLLFITDVLITDYSSVIFEASLLNIPMLFYAFDLEEYVVNRDFYYPFKNFVPGRIVRTQEDIADSIKSGEYGQDKIKDFKHRFFDDLDGKSSERVADFILSLLDKQQ
ncbi:MAG: CDP-glycerol glycerophosphotransferase family protein, partial [Lachnospiraceae bacterium]|nr:CDP-glycerol glycerophosphotransferase family protein [Lachnospiraceae bacterium]